MASSPPPPPRRLTIAIPCGSLGVSIQKGGEGGRHCVVAGKAPGASTPLEARDVILSLNGITLADVEGGVQAWVKLFKVFDTGERNVVVQRCEGGGVAGAAMASTAAPKGSANEGRSEMTKHALKDSTKHNAGKKQKVDGKFSSERDKLSTEGTGKGSIEVISLLDDSDEEDASHGKGSGELVAGGSSSNLGAIGGGSATATSEPEVMEVSASSASMQWRRASTSSTLSSQPRGNLKDDRSNDGTNGSGEEEEEEELAVVGTKGQNALADFPHSRENCVTHPFATSSDKKQHSANCYCYVCDIPAADCKEWAAHCEASHDDPRWCAERDRAKRRAREPAPAPAPVSAQVSRASASYLSALSRAVSSSYSTSRSGSGAPQPEFSVRKLLEKVTRVHPVEMTPPAGSGFTTELRHYQKQSVAFMVDTERTLGRGGFLCDEVGMGKSAVVLALVATNPANASTLSTRQQVMQSLETMKANERKRFQIQMEYNRKYDRVQGFEQKVWKLQERMDKRLKSELSAVGKIAVKTTVVLTSVSLMGQWEDEVAKHAPGLTVKTFHATRTKTKNYISLDSIEELLECDVLISTSTFKWPTFVTSNVHFRRVVHDESHLFGTASAKMENANLLQSPLRWGVTATPMGNSCRGLSKQIGFLKDGGFTTAFQSLENAVSSFQTQPSERVFDNLIDVLQTFMIRHTKSQRINGSEALALPPAMTSTVMLSMSKTEDKVFNKINSTASTVRKHCEAGVMKFTAERTVAPQMSKALGEGKARGLVEVIYVAGTSVTATSPNA